MKYIFGHSDDQNILPFIFHTWTQGSWHRAPKTLWISWATRAVGASFVRIFALLSSVPEITSEPWSWNTCLVIHNKPFPLQLGSLISDFQKTPKTGNSLPGQLSRNRGLKLSGPTLKMGWGLNPSVMVSDFMNHAYEMQPPWNS